MRKSELIQTHHLTRKAVVYVRQSSPHQQLSNQESLRLQYALKKKARELGWQDKDIKVIDCDLGISAKSSQNREGFKGLLAEVALGQVGIIFSYEVTRLSRNCTDLYPLLDMCSFKGCLIADTDGVYDPSTSNGRLILGIKGQISELELHTIRNRLTAGILSQADRGELALRLPVGLVRDELGQVHKDPNLEVQHSIELIFSTFERLKSGCKVARFFRENNILIPRRDNHGDLYWRRATEDCIAMTLGNPAYAGAFVYGRTEKKCQDPCSKTRKRLAIEEWKYIRKDKYPSYVSWETFEQIIGRLKENSNVYRALDSKGVVKGGKAMLHGIVYCEKCGHKMLVKHKPMPRYVCEYLKRQHSVPTCQAVPCSVVDEKVIEAFLEALSPAEFNIYAKALKKQNQMEDEIDQSYKLQLKRLEYQESLARRQYDRSDPDNRLVTAELERRWESALQEVKLAKEDYAQYKQNQCQQSIPNDLKEVFCNVGKNLPSIWNKGILPKEKKKALIRCLVDKVILDRFARDQVKIRIVWKGGEVSTFERPLHVGNFSELSQSKKIEQKIISLHKQGESDEEIAKKLTELGYRSPMKRDRFLPSTVRGVRLKNRFLMEPKLPLHSVPNYLNLKDVAELLEVNRIWLYRRIKKGVIIVSKDPKTRTYLFPDNPETLELLKKLKDNEISQVKFL